jgi:virulence-associated protein VagC
MKTVVDAKVTSQGVLVPRPLIAAWGDVKEVEIEQRSNAIIIKPKATRADQLATQIVSEMKAVGLVEELPWLPPPVISPEERARLARKMSHGKPLSEVIVDDREDRA